MPKKKKEDLEFVDISPATAGNTYISNVTKDVDIGGKIYHLESGKKIELDDSEQVQQLIKDGVITKYQSLDRRIK